MRRERHKEDPRDHYESLLLRENDGNQVTVLNKACPKAGETRPFGHPELKANKEKAIRTRFHDRFELSLQ